MELQPHSTEVQQRHEEIDFCSSRNYYFRNVLEKLDNVDSGAVLATSGKDIEAKSDYEIALEGKVKNVRQNKIMQTGRT
jgi:hypothetical protein